MLHIDGSQGEGGGQILRSSAALSAITGTPFQISRIRAGRKKPGLKRQHVTALRAAAEVCDAELDGAEPGANEIQFTPGPIRHGDFEFKLGTAGSTTLVAQTLLPILLRAPGPSTLSLEGGTHNPFAPPFDFLDRAYLPLLRRMGANVTATLVRSGFYPAGGGRIEIAVEPCPALGPLELMDRGHTTEHRIRALVSNLPEKIGERECDVVRRRLQLSAKACSVEDVSSPGPGNVLLIELGFQHVTEVITAFGEKGRKAEHVARDAARRAQGWLESEHPVGEYLADQLLLPMALGHAFETGGGRFLTGPLSDHSTTHIDIIREFLDVDVRVNTSDEDVEVLVGTAG